MTELEAPPEPDEADPGSRTAPAPGPAADPHPDPYAFDPGPDVFDPGADGLDRVAQPVFDSWPAADHHPAPVVTQPGPAPAIDPQPVADLSIIGSWVETVPALALGPTSASSTANQPPGRPAGRAVDGRLARVHLRGGLLTLARASLEQMAGAGALDREALGDLAEARWRSGDLEGAAEAAAAHLEAGGDEPLAHLIVAEEADRQGSLVDSRRHAAVVRERVGAGLDRLLAGEVRSTAWPLEGVDWMDEGATGPGRWGLLAGGREVADPEPGTWHMVPPPSSGSPIARPRPPLAAMHATAGGAGSDRFELAQAAGRELRTARVDLDGGALLDAVDRLCLVLRLDPALSPVILPMTDQALAAVGERHAALVALHLLRGDVYRGLGREMDAQDAYQESMRALAARATPKEST